MKPTLRKPFEAHKPSPPTRGARIETSTHDGRAAVKTIAPHAGGAD